MVTIPELYRIAENGRALFMQKERCSGCGFCIDVCSRGILREQSDESNSRLAYPPKVKEGTNCTFCRLCEYACPDFAIYVVGGKNG